MVFTTKSHTPDDTGIEVAVFVLELWYFYYTNKSLTSSWGSEHFYVHWFDD